MSATDTFVPAESIVAAIRRRSAAMVDATTGTRPILPAADRPMPALRVPAVIDGVAQMCVYEYVPPAGALDGDIRATARIDIQRALARLAEWSRPTGGLR